MSDTALELDDFGTEVEDEGDGLLVFTDDVPRVRATLKPVENPRIRSPRYRCYWTPARVLSTIKEDGPSYSDKPSGCQSAAERIFGSWADACRAAGVEPPARGRPKKA